MCLWMICEDKKKHYHLIIPKNKQNSTKKKKLNRFIPFYKLSSFHSYSN